MQIKIRLRPKPFINIDIGEKNMRKKKTPAANLHLANPTKRDSPLELANDWTGTSCRQRGFPCNFREKTVYVQLVRYSEVHHVLTVGMFYVQLESQDSLYSIQLPVGAIHAKPWMFNRVLVHRAILTSGAMRSRPNHHSFRSMKHPEQSMLDYTSRILDYSAILVYTYLSLRD